jgi:hypothetical protein
LARLNWHPTIDAQLNAIDSRRESERLKIENSRLAALESKLDSLLLSVDSSSPIPPRNRLPLSETLALLLEDLGFFR